MKVWATLLLAITPAWATDWLPGVELYLAQGSDAPQSQRFSGLLGAEHRASGWSLNGLLRAEADQEDRLEPGPIDQQHRSPANRRVLIGERASAELRELYLDHRLGEWTLRSGKQQIVWGSTDGIKVLDVVNPQSFREYLLDEPERSRIPLWSLRGRRPLGDAGTIDWVLIPDLSFHELAGPDALFAITSPLLTPQGSLSQPSGLQGLLLTLSRTTSSLPVDSLAPAIDPLLIALAENLGGRLPPELLAAFAPELQTVTRRPRLSASTVEVGTRLGLRRGRNDLTLTLLRHHADLPYVTVETVDEGLEVQLDYQMTHTLGLQASRSFGSGLLRFEGALTERAPLPVVSLPGDDRRTGAPSYGVVLGYDQLIGDQSLLSIQLGALGAMMDERHIPANDHLPLVSLLWRDEWIRNRLTGELFTMATLDRGDALIRLRTALRLDDSWQLRVGGDHFLGDRQGVFGQFRDRERLIFELSWTP